MIMTYFCLFLFFISLSAMAEVKHLVLDLEGTVFVNVPPRLRDASNEKASYVSISEGGRTNVYRIYPSAVEVLKSLSRHRNIVIHAFARKKRQEVDQLLKASALSTLWEDQAVARILDSSALTKDKTLDLRTITSDISQMTFITTQAGTLIPEQLEREWILAPRHFFYETFEQLQSEKKTLQERPDWPSKQALVPSTEGEWKASNQRMLILHERILFGQNMSQDLLLQRGLRWANNKYKDIYFSWEIEDRRAHGCMEKDIRTDKVLEHHPLGACLERLEHFSYRLKEEDLCYEFTQDLVPITPSPQCSRIAQVTYDKKAEKYVLEYLGIPEGKFNLFRFNRAQGVSGRVKLPRTAGIYYRGMKPGQYDLGTALRAMFGDNYAGIESKNLTAFKHYLLKNASPIKVDLSYRDFKSDLDQAALAYPQLDEQTAKLAAFIVLDEKLGKLSSEQIINDYLLYESSSYQDWSADLVFGTVYYWGAHAYGDIIVTYSDSLSRGIDLNWFNQTVGATADLGEYVLPLEIRPEDILGFQQLSRREAFYKIVHQGKTYVLVFSNDGCLTLDTKDQRVYACAAQDMYNERNTTIYPTLPAKTKIADPIAILGLCEKERACTTPPELKSKYAIQPRALSLETLKDIKKFNFFAKELQILP